MAKIMNIEDYRNEDSHKVEELKKQLEAERRKNYMLQCENDMLYEQAQTFNLPPKELQALSELSKAQDLPKHKVILAAFRLYHDGIKLMNEQGLSDWRDIKWPKFNLLETFKGNGEV